MHTREWTTFSYLLAATVTHQHTLMIGFLKLAFWLAPESCNACSSPWAMQPNTASVNALREKACAAPMFVQNPIWHSLSLHATVNDVPLCLQLSTESWCGSLYLLRWVSEYHNKQRYPLPGSHHGFHGITYNPWSLQILHKWIQHRLISHALTTTQVWAAGSAWEHHELVTTNVRCANPRRISAMA